MSHLATLFTIIAGMLAGFAAAVPLVWHQRCRTERWRHLATHDDTTGLPNRRAITTFLHHAVADGYRPGVILIDLDRFKTINDTLGHEAGNDLLRHVADRLLTLEQPVVVGRLSGDEFVAIIQDGTLEQTAATAHDVWAAISGLPYRAGDDLVEVSASVGYTVGHHAMSPRQLLRQADFAMYVAKQAGRDRVHGHLPANDQTSTGTSCLRPGRYRDRR